VQGDEPLTLPAHVDAVVRALQAAPRECVYSTAATPMSRAEDISSRSRVKVVVDTAGHALYFSRAVIPGGHAAAPAPGGAYLLHLGLQCYDAAFLARFPDLPPTPLQLAEDLEQLKALEHGYKLRVVTVRDEDGEVEGGALVAHGVDEPGDVARVEAALAARRTRLQRAHVA
jgi:3-deoxy-manno-octulosonate cytidylyltransferase (CMP-KDO synthetase)